MRRVLFVLGGRHLPGSITGETVSLDALCRRLHATGVEPLVVCGREPRSAIAPAALSYNVIRLDDPIAAMFEMAARLAPDAVVVVGTHAAIRIMEYPAALGRKLHVRFGNAFLGYPQPPAESAPLLRYSVPSRFLAMLAKAHLGVDAACIPPVVEPDDYACARSGEAILFVNPIAAKGAHLVGAIARRLPHRRFLVVPSWSEHQAFPHIGFRLANIETAESTRDMRRVYERARLVLMPTMMEEGWGRVVSEAQISGIPAVASDRGGLPEAVGPGGIVLSLAEPVERWCEEIESLFESEERYAALSSAARRHARRPEMAPDGVLAHFLDFLAN